MWRESAKAIEQLVAQGELQYLATSVSLEAVALAACRGRLMCCGIIQVE